MKRDRSIDLDEGTLRVRRSLQIRAERGPDGETTEFHAPKTSRSARTVRLPQLAREVLKGHKAAQNQRRLLLGAGWPDEDLVVENGTGRPVYPDSFSSAFKRIARKAGAPNARLHDLRHSLATGLGQRGTPLEYVSALLGHSTPGFTLTQYRHVWAEMAAPATAAIDDMLGTVGNPLESEGDEGSASQTRE